MTFCSVQEAVDDLRQGRIIILVSSRGQEAEGELLVAAEKVTPEAINFMATMGRGLISLALPAERTRELGLPLMVDPPEAPGRKQFTITVDAREGVTTGVSAFDRAFTIRRIVDPSTRASDFVRPGHVLPVRARDRGVLAYPETVEAAVELSRLAGLYPAGVLCEIVKDDGTMARLPDLEIYSRRHSLKMCCIADLVEHLAAVSRRPRFARGSESVIETAYGPLRMITYQDSLLGTVHLALVHGRIAGPDPVPVMVHTPCMAGEILAPVQCDCRHGVERALARIGREEAGVIVYVRDAAASLPGCPVRPLHARGLPPGFVAAQILRDLGVSRVRLFTHSDEENPFLPGGSITVIDRVPLETETGHDSPHNVRYLAFHRPAR